MTSTDDGRPDEGQGAHGPAIAGKAKGRGLLNGPHREMIIMVASVVGVGLAYATLHRSSAAGSTAAQTSSLSYPGSSATLSSGQVAGFDQSAVAGLQTMLANQSDQLASLSSALPANYGAGSAPSTPSPLAAGLFAPSDSQNFALYGNGTVAQVQNDGSQLGLTWGQWQPLLKKGAHITTTMPGSAPVGAYYETSGNLAHVPAGAPGANTKVAS